MSENEKKDTTPESVPSPDADAVVEETPARLAESESVTEGTVASPATTDDTSDGSADEGGSSEGDVPTQVSSTDEPPEDPALAEAAVDAPEQPSGKRDDDDSEDVSAVLYHSFGVTAPGEGRRPVQADLHPDLDDETLRARGMEPDHQPNGLLILLIIGLIGFMGAIFIVGMQLYYLSIEDARRDRGAAVDRTLLQIRTDGKEAVQTFSRDEETGEVRIPIADARRLLVENPQWIARHPLAPAPTIPTPPPEEAAPADDPADALEGDSASIDND